MKGFGGREAFDVGGLEKGRQFVNNVKLCTLATSLGGVETVVRCFVVKLMEVLYEEQFTYGYHFRNPDFSVESIWFRR
jgi:cystathionine beta-lyase/cystathionine gamma-synthase